MPQISQDITEEQFIEQAIAAIGPLKKTSRKTLEKESFIKVFKYTGDFAKLKNREVKKQAQERRVEFFNKDNKKYIDALKKNIQEEERAYEASSTVMFDKLCLTPAMFEKTQQELMNDPYVSMELFNLGIAMEQPSIKTPDALNPDKTIELVKASNDFAFDLFKNNYLD